MEAKELRVGSIVRNKVFGDYIYGVVKNGAEIDIVSNSKDYSPIPLTEDILLKCGFEVFKTIKEWHKDYYINIDNRVAFLKHIFISVHFIEGNSFIDEISLVNDTSEYNEGSYFSIENHDILHLHQLQNLYFALTGKELEVNL